MDIKETKNKAASTLSKSSPANIPEHKNEKKRRSEDVFDVTSKKPAHKRPPQSASNPGQSFYLKDPSKDNLANFNPQSPSTLQMLETRLANNIAAKDGDSRNSATLAEIGRAAQERGLPLVFTLDVGSKSSDRDEPTIIPFTQEYLGSLGAENAGKSKNPVYIFFVSEKKVHHLGLARDYFSRKHAMMGYVPTFNETASAPEAERTPDHFEFAGMGFLGFQYGIGMPTNTTIAANFLRLIPEEERKETFSKLLVESLTHHQYDTALLCVPHSKGIHSYDEEGYDALNNALRPGAEKVLRRLVADTTEKDLRLLADSKKYALFAKWPRAAQILEDHAGTLGYTLDKE